MNLFNCFQAMAFYTASPLAIQWLFANNHDVWGWIIAAGLAVGYILTSISINIAAKEW